MSKPVPEAEAEVSVPPAIEEATARICVKCNRQLRPTEPMLGEGFCFDCAPPLDPNSTQAFQGVPAPERIYIQHYDVDRRVEGHFYVTPPTDHVEYVRADSHKAKVEALTAALTCDGNSVGAYTLLDWCADRLHIIADGDVGRLGSVESQRQIVDMLRRKGSIARAALVESPEKENT